MSIFFIWIVAECFLLFVACALCNSWVYQSLAHILFHAHSALVVCWCSEGCRSPWPMTGCCYRCEERIIHRKLGWKWREWTRLVNARINFIYLIRWSMQETIHHDPASSLYNKIHCEMVREAIWFHVNIPKNDNVKRCMGCLVDKERTHIYDDAPFWILYRRENNNLHVNF